MISKKSSKKIENYIIDELLGKGQYGKVYLTKVEGEKGVLYATKVYDRDKVDGKILYTYVNNEFKILRYLKHPNICKFIDLKRTKKHYYFISEYCNGGELSEALEKYKEKNGTPFTEEIVQHFMRQIIDCFNYIHESKIIHRDIKLENILLNYENEEDKMNLNLMKAQVKIIDFGFSCMIGPNNLKYTFLGSPLYMDPIILKQDFVSDEERKQLGYNESADIWSIGAICYEMLIGYSPFNAYNEKELYEKIEKGNYEIPTNMSYEIVSFINGMLQYNSKKRLTASQLIRHDFLTKDVKEFKKINLEKISNKVSEGMIKMNSKQDNTIWSIFNKEGESLLSSIKGNTFIKPKDKNEEMEFSNQNEQENSLKLSSNGIPENPIDENIIELNEEEMNKLRQDPNFKENNYICDGSIFDF